MQRQNNNQRYKMNPLSILPLQGFQDNVSPEGGVAFIPHEVFEAFFAGNYAATIMGIIINNDITNRAVAIKCMPHDETDDCIFVPEWVREYLGQGTARINKVDFDALQQAYTIRARVIDNEMYHIDIKEQLEDLLSDFKFIQANIVLTVEIETMGGYPAQIWIEDVLDEEGNSCVGPAVLGEEIRLDMGEPLEHAPEFDPVVAPAPLPSPVMAPEPEPVIPEHMVPEMTISPEEQRRIAREARLRRFA